MSDFSITKGYAVFQDGTLNSVFTPNVSNDPKATAKGGDVTNKDAKTIAYNQAILLKKNFPASLVVVALWDIMVVT